MASVSPADRDTDGANSMIDQSMAAAEPGKRDGTRILLFGMDCAFTEPIAELLLTAPGVRTAAIVLASTAPRAPASACSWRGQLATNEQVTIIELSERRELLSRAFVSTLATFESDLIVVACFPWRLPAPVLALPKIASINIHPSLLPDGRGPEPIFWAFRRDLDSTGVTLHVTDEGLDTGPIIAQRRVAIPSDATMPTLERSIARIGADMLSEFLNAPSPSCSVSAWPQPVGIGHSAPFPDADDLRVTTSWKATKAARFINGVTPVYEFIEVVVLATGQRLAVAEVLGIEKRTSRTAPVLLKGDHAWIEFSDGVLHCRVRSMRQQLTFGP